MNIDPRILNLRPSAPALVARRVRSAAPPVLPDDAIEDFFLWPGKIKGKNQGQYGACNGHAAATALEYSRAMQGMPHVSLSAWWVYGMLVRGRDVGSSIMAALALCEDEGVAPEAAVAWGDFSGRYAPDVADDAVRFRILVGEDVSRNWRATLAAVAMRQSVNLAVCANDGWLVNRGSLDANGCPPVGRGDANHAVMVGGGIKTLRNGKKAVWARNSWPDWGVGGGCWLTEDHLSYATWTEGYVIKAAASDPQDIGAIA